MLWNSIATGKRPEKHGIHGFMEPDPQNGGVRPVTSTSRKVKAIWNILTQRGYKTHVVGWFAGHPAEPINGISVSDLYPYAAGPLDEEWPLPPGAVHPESMRETFAKLRMHPAEVTEAAILPWIPRAAEIDQEKDKGLQSFAKILAENCSIHNAATWILQNRDVGLPRQFITTASITSAMDSCTTIHRAWKEFRKTSLKFTKMW